MSKDIRSYFMVGGSKPAKPKSTTATASPNDGHHVPLSKKRKQNIILDSSESSDDDDDFVTTKKTKVLPKSPTGQAKKKAEEKKPDLKPIANVADILGSKPAKRSLLATLPEKEAPSKKVKKPTKEKSKKPVTEIDVHSDDDFEATLEQLDEIDKIEQQVLGQEKNNAKPNDSKPENSLPKLESQKLKETTPNKPSKHQKDSEVAEKQITPSSSSKTHPSSDDVTPDALEKRRHHAEQYRKYMQRAGPAHLHSKDIPQGAPNCLQGLTFVVTGVLDSIDRDEAAEIIKGYGGKVTGAVSKNTSYLVAGNEPGPAKMEKASKLGTPVIDEDGLLELIRTKLPFAATPSPNAEKQKGKTRDKSPSKDIKTPTDSKMKQDKPSSQKAESQEPPQAIKKESFYSGNSKHSTSSSSSSKASPSTQSPSTSSAAESQCTQSPDVQPSGQGAETEMWVDKYKPQNVKQIIGQQGDHSPANKLKYWLEHWATNNAPGTGKKPKPAPWAKNDDGAAFKAALLSGPPGIGKTTTVQLVCKELGFDIVEFNASDTRSKKLLHDEVREQMGCKTLVGFINTKDKKKALSQKRVLLMEEVDGVAGTQDRGGIPELIMLIKESKIPVICTCNDRNSQKLRSLANYCFDLRFQKPRLEQIRGAMLSLCFKEKVKIPPEALSSIIEGTNHDIRQVIHHLSLWSAGQLNMDQDLAKQEASKSRKVLKLGPWDVTRKVFTEEEQKGKTLNDKAALFFHDYSLGPLFVQENYLAVAPHGLTKKEEGMPRARLNQKEVLRRVADAADCIAKGDLIDNCIRGNSSWGLLPVQAIFSSVAPGAAMSGHFTRQIAFPSWLGKNSRANKFSRLLSELQMHMRLSISGSKEAVALDYLTAVRNKVIRHVVQEGQDGIPASLETMEQYHLLREDLDNMNELCNWGTGQVDPWSRLTPQVKTAFTRAYNKANILTPYTIAGAGVKGGRRRGGGGGGDMDELEELEGEEGEEVEVEEEEEEDLTADSMIKAKKPSAKASNNKTSGGGGRGGAAKGSGSTRGGRGRGKK